MDIEALRLLQGRKKALESLPNVSDPKVTFESYEQTVNKTMTQTKNVIEKVSNYAKTIREELEDNRSLVQKCTIKIGEQIQELMKNNLLKDTFVPTTCTTEDSRRLPLTGNDIDQKKLGQVQTMQRLAEQQQKLMAFIAETEELALKVESDAVLTYSDFAGMKGHLDQWCICLETLEERESRIKEKKEKEEADIWEKEEAERRRKEREEDEKRKQEEAERQQKEKEEREAEEKRKRQEEENKRREWMNWPVFIYKNERANKFGQNICCIIFACPDGIKERHFQCEVSDLDSDLDKCLESNDEQIISSLITVNLKKPKSVELKMPIRIYVPCVTHDETLEPKLKFMISGRTKWHTRKTLPTVDKEELQGITFAGVEIPVKNLKQFQCVAVARHKRDETEVDEDGKVFEPEVDRNIKVKFPPKAFRGKAIVATKSVPWTNKDIENASKKHKELMNIKTAGSYIDISCDKATRQDSHLQMYDFGWVVDKKLNKEQSINQETLNRCSRWLVNNMNSSTADLQEVFDSDFVEQVQASK